VAGADRPPADRALSEPLRPAEPPRLSGVEEALAAFLAERSEDAFRRLYRALTPRLYGFALRLLGAPADAEEAVQEAWVRAVRGLDRFAGRSRFETWVGGIVVRCCLEHRRRTPALRPRRIVEIDSPAAASALVDEAVGPPREPAQLDVGRALRALPDGYRAVLLLHDLYGYTHLEIASMLEIAEGTSKSQLTRARRAARALLDSRPTTGDPRPAENAS
jgi:RNA polymerase sigma-70 factor (ECF subfamily)